MTGEYLVSSKQATGLVKVEKGIIVETIPIFKKFVGQPFGHLLNWLKDFHFKQIKEFNENNDT